MTKSHSSFGRDPSQWNAGSFNAGAAAGVSLLTAGVTGVFVKAIEHRQTASEVECLKAQLHAEQVLRNWHVDKAIAAEARATAAEKNADAMKVTAARALAELKRMKAAAHLQR